MAGKSYRYLLYGRSRRETAAALVEYRAYIAKHPDDSLADFLAEVVRNIRAALKEQRRIQDGLRRLIEPNANEGLHMEILDSAILKAKPITAEAR